MREEELFKLEFVPQDLQKGYEGGAFIKWPIIAKVSLGGVPLAEDWYLPVGRNVYQNGGYNFMPLKLIDVGMKIANGDKTAFQFGDGKHIRLDFDPEGNNKVKVSLDKKLTRTTRLAFDPSVVRPVIESVDSAAYEFLRFYDDLVSDVLRYCDAGALELLREGHVIMRGSRYISDLFNRKGNPLTRIPRKLISSTD